MPRCFLDLTRHKRIMWINMLPTKETWRTPGASEGSKTWSSSQRPAGVKPSSPDNLSQITELSPFGAQGPTCLFSFKSI